MNTQELFDKMSHHLLTQMDVSRNPDHTCAYRGEKYRMCAVGVLIKDELYKPSFEGEAADGDNVRSAVELSIGRTLDSKELQMMRLLQHIHDYDNVCRWEAQLAMTAVNLGLAFTKPETSP